MQVLGAICAAAAASAANGQTWTRLAHNPPSSINLMLLLSDGTVMAARNSGSTIRSSWYRLTPDSQGHYVNGTWTTLASMADTRLYYSSQVLMDGRVFVAGGEYGTGSSTAEVYDPVSNTWSPAPVPTSLMDPSQNSPVTGSAQGFLDSMSEILPNGDVLIAPVSPRAAGEPLIYHPATNTWSAGPHYYRGVYQDEASWVKLPDSTILTIDPFGTNSERYNPATNTWINDSNVPVQLYDAFGYELGAALLLANGKAFYLGSTGHTALYTPSGSAVPGVWTAGPDIPDMHGTPDAPAAVMPNGRVLCAVSPLPTMAEHFPSPTTFYEYDPFSNSFTSVGAPTGASDGVAPFATAMLVLPDGGVLYSHMSTSVYVYQSSGAALDAAKPTILDVTPNGDGSYHLTGLGLNGISEGAAYGDDLQMNSNYPLVRINHSNGNVYFARTYNWSSTGVMTGNQVVSTEYRPPASLPAGAYTISAVANGVASDPFDPFCVAPSIASHPAAQRVCPAGAASFGVAVTGSAPLTYRWQASPDDFGWADLSEGSNQVGTVWVSVQGSGTPNVQVQFGQVTVLTHVSIRCLVSNPCSGGGTVSDPATLTICPADFNCDASLTVADIFSMLAAWFTGNPRTDFDNSGGPNVADVFAFLTVWFHGCG